jgi:hypothetical protein
VGTEDIAAAIRRTGLRVSHVSLRYQGNAQVIDVAGWHADGQAFTLTSDSFTGNPVEFATAFASNVIARGASTKLDQSLKDGIARMSLADKMRLIADKSKTVPAKLLVRADRVLARYDALDLGSEATFSGLEGDLDSHEAGLKELEAAHAELLRGTNQ